MTEFVTKSEFTRQLENTKYRKIPVLVTTISID